MTEDSSTDRQGASKNGSAGDPNPPGLTVAQIETELEQYPTPVAERFRAFPARG